MAKDIFERLIEDHERHRQLIEAIKAVSTVRHVYQLKPLSETDKAPFAELPPATNDRAADKTDPNQVVYLAFTSGTTSGTSASCGDSELPQQTCSRTRSRGMASIARLMVATTALLPRSTSCS